MKNHMALLSTIVETDQEIQDLTEEQEEVHIKVRDLEKDTEELQQSYSEKNAQRELLDKEIKKVRGLAEAEIQNLKNKEERLHTIKTQKEYQAVSKEIASSKTLTREKDQEIKNLESQIEALAAEIAPIEESLKNKKLELETEQASIQERVDDLQNKIRTLEEKRSTELGLLPEDVRRKFMQIRKNRQPAAALVADGTCQECFMQISPQLYIEIQKHLETHQCPNCHRLLYIHL